MSRRTSAALERLESLRLSFGRGMGSTRLRLLRELESATLADPGEVARLHDLLLFARAYPDSRSVLARVERMLADFAERDDLRRDRPELVNSGIQGTEIRYPFYWFTLRWLAERWPDRLQIDWSGLRGPRLALLDRRLAMLQPYCESLALEEAALPTRDWIDRLKGADETDAVFLVRRFEALRADPLPRESIFEEMDVPFRLRPGPDTPCTTHGKHPGSPLAFQRRPLVRSRDTFRREIDRPPLGVRSAPRGEARRLIQLARELMVVRERDLDCFVHADERDVRVVDYPDSLQFVCYGSTPERRQMLDAAYGFLMLRCGAPIGYVLSASLFGSSEVAFNVSPTFRGAEAAQTYGRTLSMVRHLFGAETMMVDPYQMGHDNPEGLRSGAWWFYYKLGFRPRDPTIARLAEEEQRKVRARPGYRTSLSRLNRLSSVNMYLHLGQPRDDVIGEFARENVGLWIAHYLAGRFGSDRERGLTTCSREVARLLGLRSTAGFRASERLAWERWAPLVRILPGVADWSAGERAALARVVRAKGGRRESDFVARFDAHPRLRHALWQLSKQPPPS